MFGVQLSGGGGGGKVTGGGGTGKNYKIDD